jgi:hypothetical protein
LIYGISSTKFADLSRVWEWAVENRMKINLGKKAGSFMKTWMKDLLN